MPVPGEHKTVQARIVAYAQEIEWTSVTCAEAERQRGFALYPYALPGNGAREMMELQLVAAQTRVHDLDLLGLEAAGAAVVNCTEIRR